MESEKISINFLIHFSLSTLPFTLKIIALRFDACNIARRMVNLFVTKGGLLIGK